MQHQKRLDSLPEKLDTVIKENGKNLSGGQKQRIAIARLVIRDYAVILADKITASLDEQTTEQVMDNLLSLDCMAIVITHDTKSEFMKRFQRIYMVRDGVFTEQPIKNPAASNGVSSLQRCRAAGYLVSAPLWSALTVCHC